MDTIATTVRAALQTATQAPLTKEATSNTAAWAKWAEFEMHNDDQLERMVAAMGRFIRDIKDGAPPRWLSLLGPSGAGKTHLAKRITRWARTTGNAVHFCSWRAFGEEMLTGDYSRTERLRDDWLVALDDIASKRDKSGIASDKLDSTLDARLGRWTVITANLTLAQIAEQLDQRIASRMLRGGSEVVSVNAADWNLREFGQPAIVKGSAQMNSITAAWNS